ncbi:MAG: hypothetical protein HRU36_02695 [Rickettsiales bacterium]|nr:hypothetical protein [Rickettsiales bacterium]
MIETVQIILFCLIGIATALMLYNLLRTKQKLIQFISVNVITSYVIVFICSLVVFDNNKSSYVDVALIYALVSFVVSVAVLKYYKNDKC